MPPIRVTALLLPVLLALLTTAPAAAANNDDGPAYPVASFELRYLRETPLLPALSDLSAEAILLGRTDTGFVAPREGVEIVLTSLDAIADANTTESYHASALQTILLTLRDALLARDLMGINCFPDPIEIDRSGVDLRSDAERSLTIIIAAGVVTEMRTIAAGDRVREGGSITPDTRIDHPAHQRYIDGSPVRPYRDGDAEHRDLLHKSEIDRYLFFLGRHPGRLVDLTVGAGRDVGGVALDYRVTENNPLVIYGQVSNTGTRETDYWRERFGLMHTQLTGNDDIFSLDYATAQFDQTHAVFATYERPFPNERVRWQVAAGWSEYTASDIGIFNDTFSGRSWNLSARAIWNVYQNRELFIDLFGGVRFDDLKVENSLLLDPGEESFITPFIGARLDRTTAWFSTQASASFDLQPGITDVETTELQQLGRTSPDDTWAVFRWSGTHSFYLEPLIDKAGWEDASTPESSTLAHEILLGFRGQWAIDSRVISQEQYVAGGHYTVRGYPQSFSVGDNAVIASAAYRFHLPHAFTVNPSPRELFGEPFRTAPQFVYGTPDWDLVLKGFVDVGWTDNNDRLSFESSDTLVGAGVGIEFLYKRNLNVRLDWGFALEGVEERGVASGANRLHLVATILF